MLGEMIGIFFAAKPSQLCTLHVVVLPQTLEQGYTHPGIKQQLEQEGISMRLSSNSFAKQPVDQALQCTINADAALRQTGITAFHQSRGATRGWTVTISARSTIVRNLFETAEVRSCPNPSHELGKGKVGIF